MNYDKILDALAPVLKKTTEMVVSGSRKDKQVAYKGRIDLVTETDIAVENMLKSELSHIIPEATFLAEESACQGELGEFTWVIDPIDGTTNYAHGLPFVANSLALWHENEIALGVVNLPLLGERFTAIKGKGAYLNGLPIRVSQEKTLERSLLATGFPYAIEDHLDTVLEHLKKLLPRVQGIRRPGAAAIDLAYVACGRYEGFFESDLKPWDTAAGLLLVTEAGGKVTQYNSQKKYELGDKTILATNGLIHNDLSAFVV